VTDLIIIFRTGSDVEASLIRGLLESRGIPSVAGSDMPHSVFPLSAGALGEIRISVRPDDAEEAIRIIESQRERSDNGQLVHLGDQLEALQHAIGYRFRDRGLLEHALTHTSRAHEDVSGGTTDNESLEFLGDAVLGFVIADRLFALYPAFDEGRKSKAKAALVSTVALARLAEIVGLGTYVLLGRGEEKTGGRRKQALLADTYEALIAAIYLDGGIDATRAFIEREFATLLVEAGEPGALASDFKSALQEQLQAGSHGLPEYRLAAAEGPDHRKRFRVEVVIDGQVVSAGSGGSKKEAEQEAARIALDQLAGTDDSGLSRFR
jgi:ribonuclease-3